MSQELTDAEFIRELMMHAESDKNSDMGVHPWWLDRDDIARLRSIAARLERQAIEIDVLRTYGNKDCTAMADERLERVWSGEEPWE